MLSIRLQRVGRKHEPTFRVVLTDSRNSAKSGRFLEILGSHDPRGNREGVLKKERIEHWISKGAQPSPTAWNLFVRKGVVRGKKIDVAKKSKKAGGEVRAAAVEASVSTGEKEEKKAEALAEAKTA